MPVLLEYRRPEPHALPMWVELVVISAVFLAFTVLVLIVTSAD